ncbi:MAG: DNA polymerase III subunit gamma/tau [Myxococcota bacterium]|nr:DNA polymerase III subunit gamma/tau [Myxococcota bacterium]
MSYQVIARKWRPKVFDEVVGQRHVTTALRNAIRSDRVPHALLLTGPRGVGKTTLARILGCCLNCEKGPTDTPCGSCDCCEEIAAGRSTDVQEIDAASRTGVDDIREVIESIQYAASPGKHRIFIVDEIHMLSKQAFNALLKTLEEPPANSLFIFATTDPEKIPFTVLSRCQRYDLRRIEVADVAAQLGQIVEAEDVRISPASLLAIAREGDGSMRDAQTLLDQLIAYGGTEISDETVAEVLDLIDRRVLLAIGDACIDRDAAAALDACASAIEKGSEPKRLAAALVQLLRDLVVLAVAPESPGLVEGTDAERDELRALVARSDATRLRRMFRALVKEQEDLSWAPQPYAVLEMAIVRLATMPDGDDVERLLGRIDALERRLSGGGAGGGGGAPPPPAGRGGGGASGGEGGGRSAAPAAEPAPVSLAAPDPVDRGTPTTSAAPTDDDAPLEVVYDRLKLFAQQHNRGAFACLEGGRLAEREAGRIRLEMRNAFHAARLRERLAELESLCERFFGRPTRVELVDPTASDETSAAQPNADGSSAEGPRDEARRLRQAALQHPAVNTALEVLEAQIVDISPLGGSRP